MSKSVVTSSRRWALGLAYNSYLFTAAYMTLWG